MAISSGDAYCETTHGVHRCFLCKESTCVPRMYIAQNVPSYVNMSSFVYYRGYHLSETERGGIRLAAYSPHTSRLIPKAH